MCVNNISTAKRKQEKWPLVTNYLINNCYINRTNPLFKYKLPWP